MGSVILQAERTDQYRISDTRQYRNDLTCLEFNFAPPPRLKRIWEQGKPPPRESPPQETPTTISFDMCLWRRSDSPHRLIV